MKTVEKDVLYPGVYTLPGGIVWECSERMVFDACVNGNKMLGIGNTAAPVIWEHDLNAYPVPLPQLRQQLNENGTGREYAASVAKHTFGYVGGYRCGYEKGEPVLYANAVIPSTADVEQFEKTRFVSPKVDFDFTDFNGRFWQGATITHLASTPMPVQMRQRPVMLSGGAMVGERKPNTSRTYVLLSLNARGSTMADDKKKDGEGGAGGGGGMDLKRLKSALATHGIKIPEGVNDFNEICVAVESAGLNKDGGAIEPDGDEYDDEDDDDANPDDEFNTANTSESTVTPAMLSGLPSSVGKTLTANANKYRNRLLNLLDKVEPRAIAKKMLTAESAQKIRDRITKADDAVMLSAMSDPAVANRNRAIFQLMTLANALGVKGAKKAVSLSGSTTAVGTPSPVPPGKGGPTKDVEDAVLDRVKKRATGEPVPVPKNWM